jgi:DNA-binding MarR family transcriptional regulator
VSVGQVSALESHLGYWLRFVSNHVSASFARRLAKHDVSVAEWVVLRELLDTENTAPSDLAERMNMTRGAISKLVASLETRSLIRRAIDKTDRRRQFLALTPKGRALVPKLAAEADANDTAFFGALDARSRALLEEFLRRLVAAHDLKTIPVE